MGESSLLAHIHTCRAGWDMPKGYYILLVQPLANSSFRSQPKRSVSRGIDP